MKISLYIEDGEVSAKVSGTSKAPITKDEINVFDIRDASLKDIIGKKLGKKPNDVTLSDGDNRNLHEKNGWPVVTTNVQYKNAEVLEFTSELAAMSQKNLQNKSSVRSTFGGSLNVTVRETVSTTSNKSTKAGFGTNISFGTKFSFFGNEAEWKAEFSTSFESTVGESTTTSKEVSIGDNISISVPLDPGQSVKAVLVTTKHVVKLRVHYHVFLEGRVACYYNPPHNGHQYWPVGIEGAMVNAGMPDYIEQYEDIEITTYSGSHTELLDYNEDEEAAAAEAAAAEAAATKAAAAKAAAAKAASAAKAVAKGEITVVGRKDLLSFRPFPPSSSGKEGQEVGMMHSENDGSGRQEWQLQKVSDDDEFGHLYHIMNVAGSDSGAKFLSTNEEGDVSLSYEDDTSGRQRWEVVKAGTDVDGNFYNIKVSGGTNKGEVFLSCHQNKGWDVFLFSKDNTSGRQRWRIPNSDGLELDKNADFNAH